MEALEADEKQSKIDSPDEPETFQKSQALISIRARLNELILAFQLAEQNFKNVSKEKTKRVLKIGNYIISQTRFI